MMHEPDESCPLGMWLLLAGFVLLHVVVGWVGLKMMPGHESQPQPVSEEVAR